MIPESHPYYFLERMFSREEAVFQFSKYVYTPDSLLDQREIFDVSGSSITVDWLEEQFAGLRDDQEIAIHSKVVIDGRTLHIPMLDFAADRIGPEQLYRIKTFLPDRVFATTEFYCSGRSFHAYSSHLLGPKDWQVFLGRSLLINPSNSRQIVDSRWIGHRLIAGYCSLRLSNNSRQYKGLPAKVGIRSFTESVSALSTFVDAT
jgi:hypothetical protein